MARLNLNAKTLNLKGITTERLINISGEELVKLPTAKLEKIASRLISTANKRVARLEASGMTKQSGAYYNIVEGAKNAQGAFTKPSKVITDRGGISTQKTASSYRNELLSEVNRSKRFLQAKTSTVRGTKANIGRVETKLKQAFGTKYYDRASKSWKERELFKGTAEERLSKQKKFWDMYYKSMEKSSQFYHGMSSKRFRNKLARFMESNSELTDEQILNSFDEKLRETYENAQERETGVGSLFS